MSVQLPASDRPQSPLTKLSLVKTELLTGIQITIDVEMSRGCLLACSQVVVYKVAYSVSGPRFPIRIFPCATGLLLPAVFLKNSRPPPHPGTYCVFFFIKERRKPETIETSKPLQWHTEANGPPA